MSRTISPALQAHLAGGLLTIALLVTITRVDGTVLGLTSFSDDIVFGGVTYEAVDGLSSTALSQQSGTAPDNMEVMGFLTSDRITDADLLARKYDNADVLVQIVNWADLTMEAMILNRFRIGNVTVTDGKYQAELRGLSDILKQQVSPVFSKCCRVRRLGDLQCKVDLGLYQFTRTVSAAYVSLTGAGASIVYQINLGGGAESPFVADEFYSGGSTGGYAGTPETGYPGSVDLSAVTDPAPQLVYQTWRSGNFGSGFTYTFTGLNPGSTIHVRLHMNEYDHARSNGVGKRTFTVIANQDTALYQFDIWAQAGGLYKAIIPEFDCIVDSTGQLVLRFQNGSNHALCSGIELITPAEGVVSNGFEFASDSNVSGYYNGGIVYWLTGANAGLQSDVKNHILSSGSAYVGVRLPPPFPVEAGDTATLEAGCSRLFGHCSAKFANGINFHGEDLLPGNDIYLQIGRGT